MGLHLADLCDGLLTEVEQLAVICAMHFALLCVEVSVQVTNKRL
jgi:hypothetical protein